MELDDILKLAMKKGASDVHLKAGIMPVIRRHGILRPLSTNLPSLSGDEINSMAMKIMDKRTQEKFLNEHEVDLGYGISGLGRFRVNVFRQRGTTRMVIRNIPHIVPSFKDLNLPDVIEKIAANERGLILVTGVTGSGKSSTLAAIIDYINRHKNKHILTIEDPIEFLIRDRKSIITQRELGVDATGFAASLKAALRQDPDVILIGEMRDRETIETALTAAETGHLVLSTLHTLDAQETINRIVAVFDPHHQHQIRMQIAAVLKAVISQRLARRQDKNGFVPAVEILINNTRVREMIEDRDKTKYISQAIEEGQVSWGMQSFDQSLMDLIDRRLISFEEALQLSTNPEDFRVRYSGVDAMDGKKWSEGGGAVDKRVSQNWKEISEVEIEVLTEIKKRQALESKKKKDNGDPEDEA
ncbi:MAG: type IV pilus twitching motility protein PilT [Bdellovibrionaceae bacterium]|nr:type IV pilus twitching motility protein PilT [Pseudobdellovibrionaceae bacterium]